MIIGRGYEDKFLTDSEIHLIISEAVDQAKFDNKKLLIIIPDHSRTAPIGRIFKILYELAADRVKTFDILIALGTHPPMTDEQIYERVAITEGEHKAKYPKARFFNHLWKDPDALISIGTIPEDKINEIMTELFARRRWRRS